MLIVETSIFTRRLQGLLGDEEYRLLQLHLAGQPEVGAVIKGTGGLRKSAGRLEHVASAEA